MGKRKKHAHQPAGLRGDDQGGAQVLAADNVPAEKPADPVSADPGEPEAAGAVEHQAEDPLAAVGEPAAAVGAEAQGEGADAAEAVAEVTSQAQEDGNGEAQEAVSEDQQDTAAQGQRDPDGEEAAAPDEAADGAAGGGRAGEDCGGDGATPVEVAPPLELSLATVCRAVAAITRVYANGGHPVEAGQEFRPGEGECMVEFVRNNPEAPVLAMYKHLEITKRLQPCEPNDEDLLVLTVFHTVAATVLDYERKQEAKRAAEAARKPKRTWPGARAFEAPTQPFSPTNYVPRR